MNINYYFSKDNIINNIAKYETYYQVALGILISTTNKKEINQNIQLEYALGSIYELIKDLENENIDEVFEIELQKQAAMDALQYFANENIKAVKNKEIDIENNVNIINDNLFFNDILLEICKNSFPTQIQKWQNIINDEVSDSIIKSLESLEEK